jgi:hypothetical protein
MVHSFLEILPLLSLALLAAAAWPQALALVGLAGEPRDWSLRLKEDPLPAAYLQGAFALALLFNALPLLQETWSCASARRAVQRKRSRQPGAGSATARTPASPEPR